MILLNRGKSISKSKPIVKLEVRRVIKSDTFTIGKLFINGKYFCDTLEDKDRGLKDTMSEFEIIKRKIKGYTAIQTGTFPLVLTWSDHFSQGEERIAFYKTWNFVLPLIKLKGWTGVRIHWGADTSYSAGCILLGSHITNDSIPPDDSKQCTTRFYDFLHSIYDKCDMQITIKDSPQMIYVPS